MLDSFAPWIHAYGYFAIIGLLMVGIFGVPVPDETLLAYVGLLAAQGQMRLELAIPAATLGSWLGVTLSYLVGRTVGERLLGWLERRRGRLGRHVERARRWFARLGKWTLPVAYFVPGVRHVAAIVAGSLDLPVGSFMPLAYPGGAAWVTTFVLLGYYLGARWLHTSARVHRIVLICVALAGAAAVAAYLWHWLRRRRKRRGGPP